LVAIRFLEETNFMSKFNSIISNLESTLEILPTIVNELPKENLKRRPTPEKWSAHEHACHLAEVQPMFFERLELILSEETPTFKPYSPDDTSDLLMNTELEMALESFTGERKRLLNKLNQLSVEDWERKANYKNFPDYSVFRMFRHLSLHDFLHIYRIEELLLKNIL